MAARAASYPLLLPLRAAWLLFFANTSAACHRGVWTTDGSRGTPFPQRGARDVRRVAA